MHSLPPGYRCYEGYRALCTYGMYSGSGQKYCTACPVGTTTTFLGATSIADCVPCPNANNVAQWGALLIDTSSTSGIENSCRISKCSAGYHLVETIGEENLFDISKVVNSANLTHTENSITSTGNPAYLGSKLNVLCPQCKADKYYLLSHDDSNHFSTFMIKGGAERYFWYADNVLHMNDIILGAIWGFYSGTFNNISIREYSSECVQCPENTYENNGKCVACPDGLYSYPGSDEYGDCSHILHIGTEQLYLRGNKQTTPSLHVQIGDQIFYGNMTQQNTPMSKHTEKHLRTNYDGTIWSIYDDSAITQ